MTSLVKNLLWAIFMSVLLLGPATADETTKKEEVKKEEQENPTQNEAKELTDETTKKEEVKKEKQEKQENAPKNEAEELEELTVKGKKEESPYLPQDTTTFLKVPTKITETPASIQIITPELVNDQNAFRLQDALRNVAGVSPLKNESKGQEYESASIRGFSQRLYRGGFRTLGTNTIDMTTVERVEVIKGPDAITYGAAEPGGIINVITKGAKLTPFKTKITGQVGSYDDYRAAVDTNCAFEDKALRLNLSYVDKKSFRDYVEQESYSIAPAFFWQIGENTSLDFRVSYKHENRMLDPGVYLDANHNYVASIDTFLGDPDTDGLDIDDSFYDLTFYHSFLPWLSMRTHAVYHHLSIDIEAIRIRGNPDANNMITQYYDASDILIEEYGISHDFIFTFDNEYFFNTLVLGIERRHISKNWHSKRDMATLGKVSIINPVYDFDYSALTITDNGKDDDDQDCLAFYLQNTLKLFDDKLHIMFGGRLDKVDARYVSTAKVKTKGDADGKSWQAGVLYELFSFFLSLCISQ